MDPRYLNFHVVDPASPDAVRCLEAYFAELRARFPAGFDPSRSVTADAHEVTPPHGVFLLAGDERVIFGCGALKTFAPGVGEIKRMWLEPSARGRGVGRRMLAALEGHAAALGHRTVRLDTAAELVEAIALYRAAGYREIPRYNDNPYATAFFEKSLASG